VADKKPRKPKAKKEIVEGGLTEPGLEIISSLVAELTTDIFVDVQDEAKQIAEGKAIFEKKYALIERLKSSVLTIEFTKVDGSTRVMNITLNDQIIGNKAKPSDEGANARLNQNPDLIVCWDVDHDGWRSFKVSSLKKINNQLV